VQGVAALGSVANRLCRFADTRCEVVAALDRYQDGLRAGQLAALQMQGIVFLEADEADTEALGNVGRVFALSRPVGLPGIPVSDFQVALEGVGFVDRNQQIDRRVGTDELAREGSVQRDEVIAAHVRQARGGIDVHAGMDGDLVEVGLVRQLLDGDAVTLGLAYQVFQRQQFGDVMPGLVRQGQAGVVAWQPLLDVLPDGPRNAALAAVVRGQRQLPVAEVEIQFAQVVERGTRGCSEVAATVVPGVLPESVMKPGGGDELPDAGCSGR